MATVEQTMMKVQRILTGPMKLRIQLDGELISVSFTDSSTVVHVRIIDWGKSKDGEARSLVRVSAPVVREVQPTPQLFEYLCREAPKNWFGSPWVNDDQNAPGKVFISMGQTLLGDYLDEEELATALWGVLAAADELDDKLKEKFGGKRWVDA